MLVIIIIGGAIMRVMNIMFGKGLGGIEQAFVDYCHALTLQQNEVIAVIQPDAKILSALNNAKPTHIVQLKNSGQWDIFAKNNLRKLIKKHQPDAIICHGNRAISFACKAAKNLCPVIGVAHNYNISRLKTVDAAFSITQDIKSRILALGQAYCYHIPNMVEVESSPAPALTNNSIGTLGRFVEKKGFDVFINAIAIVKKEYPDVKAIIAGNGEEEATLKQLAKDQNLINNIDFIGWIDDKKQFFESFNIFCLPSHHEPFGIVLIEAFSYKKPVVTTASEGPSEIATDGEHALITPVGDAEKLAAALCKLLADKELARSLATNGYKHTQATYCTTKVSSLIQQALKEAVKNYAK